ncbi:cytochrome P450 [Mycobacterium sp. ITM-2016-00317]|uniref:cytochrome P450 family protein n=1 Tax=Mycobacterium sp. ITM-2016-00317 TaxID=2099694 RepID=UPI00287FB69E|nr:cytochrome P450 [Mycobacterium sp. ITM-2016-00317]WNG88886.1 cytochrome P450 [Mycobacterium sp. ITM-2016-00317]
MLRLGPSFIQNPHPAYDLLRRQGAAHQIEMAGGVPVWLITRYAEARSLLADPRLCKDGATASALYPAGTDVSVAVWGDNMLFRDPPDHTRLRRFVTAAFTAHSVEKLRSTVAAIVDELLAAVAASAPGPVDLMQALARPLPIRVLDELLGVPPDHRDRFYFLAALMFTSADAAELTCAQGQLTQLLRMMMAVKRDQPADDLLSGLIHLRENGDRLSEEELLGTACLLIVAGYETTANLIGNGVLALLTHEAQLHALRADRSLLPATVEEALRYDSPVNAASVRFTNAPIQLGEVTIPAGHLVLIALQSANRDVAQFAGPHRFDLSRTGNRHLAFGHGAHYCLGAPLARMQAEIAFDGLLSRFDRIELARSEPLRYRPSTLLRGLHTLPVLLGRSD